MHSKLVAFPTGLVVAGIPVGAHADSLVIDPAKGQTPARQFTDEAECQGGAKQNTGFDPLSLANAAAAPPPMSAVPAETQRRGGESEAEAERQKAEAEAQQKLVTFDNAYAACLEGKGYTV